MTELGVLLLRHGYHAVARDRAARGGGDTYVSRLLGSRTVVIGEPDGARAFYDESLARRAGAVPPPLAWLLFGRGALHGTDGTVHRDRKRLVLDVLDPDTLGDLVDDVAADLAHRVGSWPGREVDLHDELVTTYGAAVLRWAGLDLSSRGADEVSRRLAEIVDGFGFAWPAYARAWRSRRWAERWARQAVAGVRSERTTPPDASALRRIADSDLDERTAAVELLNVLRPTVAVAWLGVFAAFDLARASAAEGERLRDPGAVHERYAFAQEVRRTSPFVPVLTAIALRDARVSGTRVRAGDRLLLDVVGIDHHPDHWPAPHEFRADRFLDRDALTAAAAFDLVPQGGGHPSGHRCPGESLTARLLSETVRVLADVETDLAGAVVDASRMPTLPRGSSAVRVTRAASGARA
ncbi:cytochrome P450 [Microbacterium sp. ARD31]|uniref:cytochrome P450 n=1 Tax=Microbacterium sp. ARD31 TaxID=2962576 RepID=UPI002881610C|nr:cytochrome P450 [Microbacterium sp. ARD31]MDT0187061.1 cytochrome P450 [Microbacterium sp. ARD31]